MKVFHLISQLGSGGAEAMLVKLVSKMDRERFDNRVISMRDKGFYGTRLEENGVPVYTLGMRAGIPDPRAVLKLARLLRREQPDVVQTWLYHADLLGSVTVRWASRAKLVWNIRCSDMDMRHYSAVTRWTIRGLARLSYLPDAVIANSLVGTNYHQALGYKARRWVFLPNGFDVERFCPRPDAGHRLRRKLGLGDDDFLIGMVARYDAMKDFPNLIQAAERLLVSHRHVRFVLVGRGVTTDNETLVKMLRASGILSFVSLLGEVRDVAELVAGLDLFTLTSAFGEGFPNAVGEAMSSGVPCVVTDVGDGPSVVGETGTVVPKRDSHALCEAWCDFVEMPAQRRRSLGHAARRRIEGHYALGSVVKRYEELYQSLGGGRGEGAS